MENMMLRYCSTCILLLICSLFFGRANSLFGGSDDIRNCAKRAACKTVIEYGEKLYKSQLDVCRCPNDSSCPSSNTVTRYIGMRTSEPCPHFTIYFCEPLYNKTSKICEEGQEAMSFKGSTMLPSTVEDVFCRCPTNDRLHLSTIKSIGFRKIEVYTCSMPVCNTTDVDHVCSKKTDSRSIHFLCRCPVNHVCEKPHANISESYQCQQVSHSV